MMHLSLDDSTPPSLDMLTGINIRSGMGQSGIEFTI